MKKYEYKIKLIPRDFKQAHLAEMGEDGWLLCVVGPPDGVGNAYFYFAREIEQPERGGGGE